jgi:DNA polymerase III sliding clamp (beta) subunit (PCNA family)
MNEISVPVSQLKSALPGFGKIISRRAGLPVLHHLRLTRDEQGGVQLGATDLDSHAIYHVPETSPGAPLDLLVPFEPLNQLVKGLGHAEVVSFSPDGKKSVKIKYPLGGSLMEQPLDTLPAEEFPLRPRITTADLPMGPEFGPALQQALQCCSEDPTRPTLRGAFVDVTDKKLHYIVGTNGRILYSANSFAFDLPQSVIIPDSKFLEWTDLMAAGCRLAVETPAKGPGFIQLKSDRWTFITRGIEGNFPNWKQCLPALAKPRTVIRLPAPAVKQLLEVLPHLPGNDGINRTVRLRYESDRLQVEGANEKADWSGVIVPAAVLTGKPVVIGLNREYLITALKFNLNEIQIEDPLTPLVCVSGGKRLVIMPVNLSGAATKVEPTPQTTPAPAAPPAEPRKTEMPETTKPTEPSALDQIESIKARLRELFGELNTLTGLIKQAEKDKRTTEKEVASVRQTIRSLQGVKL